VGAGSASRGGKRALPSKGIVLGATGKDYGDIRDSAVGAMRPVGLQRDIKVAEVDTYGFSAQATAEPGIGELLYGVDFYHDEVDSEGIRNGAPRPANRPVADDASYDTLGVFGTYKVTLSRFEKTPGNDDQRVPINGTPGYIVPSFHAGVRATENVTLTVSLENLTDQDYRIHGSGVNEPGCNAIFGAKVEW